MSVDQKKGFEVVSKEEFQAIGFRWEGTFAEAAEGGIRKIQAELKRRLDEIDGKVEPNTLLGLSYHDRENADSFTHYAVVEVTETDSVPEGMVSISISSHRYAKCEHRKGESIEDSYNELYSWIRSRGMKANESGLTHFEEYPMSQDPYTKDPEFAIMIPLS